jgi:hypothetical protein
LVVVGIKIQRRTAARNEKEFASEKFIFPAATGIRARFDMNSISSSWNRQWTGGRREGLLFEVALTPAVFQS